MSGLFELFQHCHGQQNASGSLKSSAQVQPALILFPLPEVQHPLVHQPSLFPFFHVVMVATRQPKDHPLSEHWCHCNIQWTFLNELECHRRSNKRNPTTLFAKSY